MTEKVGKMVKITVQILQDRTQCTVEWKFNFKILILKNTKLYLINILFVCLFVSTPTDVTIEGFNFHLDDDAVFSLSATCNLSSWDFEQVGKLIVLLFVVNIGVLYFCF